MHSYRIFADGSPKIYFLARCFVTWNENLERRTACYNALDFSFPTNTGIRSWLSFPAWKHLPWHYEPLLSMHANFLLHDLAIWVMNARTSMSFSNKHPIFTFAIHACGHVAKSFHCYRCLIWCTFLVSFYNSLTIELSIIWCRAFTIVVSSVFELI